MKKMKIPTSRWLEIAIARTQCGETIPPEELAENLRRVKHWIELGELRARQFKQRIQELNALVAGLRRVIAKTFSA